MGNPLSLIHIYAKQKLLQVQMLPVFIGIGLGVLLGSIPFYIPGFPVAVSYTHLDVYKRQRLE